MNAEGGGVCVAGRLTTNVGVAVGGDDVGECPETLVRLGRRTLKLLVDGAKGGGGEKVMIVGVAIEGGGD